MKKLFTALLVTLSVGLFAQDPVVYHVDSAAASGNGLSWPEAFTDLHEALAVAESGDTIKVAQGTYTPDTMNGDPAATFLIDQDLVLIGGYATGGSPYDPAVYETILSGDLNGDDIAGNFFSDNVMTVITVVNASPLIDGFTIQNGYADGTSLDAQGCGGGLYGSGGSPVIRQCKFLQNYATRQGGAIYLTGGTASLELCELNENLANNGGGAFFESIQLQSTGCSFSDNLTFNGANPANGGAFYAQNLSGSIKDCAFQNNSASAYGGGFELYYPDSSSALSVEITGCSFQGNTAAGGGGLSVYNFAANTEVTASDCSFSGNTVNEWGGGLAMWTFGTGSVHKVINSSMENNTANTSGGGMYLETASDSAEVLIDSCTFSQNEANATTFTAGGGLMAFLTGPNGSVTLSNSAFTGNKARISGGGASFRSDENGSGNCVVTNTVFEDNEAQWNGGMDFYHYDLLGDVSYQVSDCQFMGNHATRRGGGLGLVSVGPISFLVEDCLLDSNTSDSLYGGIHLIVNHPGTDIQISRCALLNNDGQGGSAIGGGYSSNFLSTGDYTEATVHLENCLMVGNEGPGGTIGMEDLGHMKLINCTVAENPAGGIVQSSSSVISVQNTILHNPQGTEYLALTGDVSLTSLGGNLLSDGSFGSLASPEDHINVVDPKFVGTGDYCSYYQLTDLGVDEGLEWADASDEDLCGNPRVKNNHIDIGALESETSSVRETVSGELTVFPTPTTNLLNIQWPETLYSEVEISVFNLQGKLAHQQRLLPGRPVEVSKLAPGLYTLKIVEEGKVFAGKFVKL